ncbi:MAG: hypothetical protein E4H40_02945 [Candidatus Brocadiia bacterium]|nr:MAG: hypothetical protein E4H40_02945 [Candidatus Brocadiia bacterium]
MFSRRIKIFIALSIAMMVICVARLAQLQILNLPYYREQVVKLKLERSRTRQINTLRGIILDRKGRVLATDEPKF